MVKHVIIWNLKEGFSAEEKETILKDIKEGRSKNGASYLKAPPSLSEHPSLHL